MCLPVKRKKTAVQQPLPPKTVIFCQKLTLSGHTRRIFNFKFLELNVPTWKTEETAAVPPSAAEIFFMPFLAELDNSESFETNLFFLKKIPLVFAFDTCNF